MDTDSLVKFIAQKHGISPDMVKAMMLHMRNDDGSLNPHNLKTFNAQPDDFDKFADVLETLFSMMHNTQ